MKRLDKSVIVGLHWDYPAWTDNAVNFVGLLKSSDFGSKPSGLTIAISGDASSVAQQKGKEAGIDPVSRTTPGPLR
jgi:hypothetical protein